MPEDISQASESFAGQATLESPRPAPPASKAHSDKLPPFPLAAAGLSVFNAIMGGGFLVLWFLDGNSALAVIQTLAGVCILLGLMSIVVGALILNSNRRTGLVMQGSVWSKIAIVSGLFLLGMTVMLPLISALSVLVGTNP